MAEYTLEKAKALNIEVWKNPHAITVVLPPQPLDIQQKWQLATEESMSHIICMPNVTADQIDSVLDAIASYGNQTFPKTEEAFNWEHLNTTNVFHI